MKRMFVYTMTLEDGTTFDYTFEGGIGYNDKEKQTTSLITSAIFVRQYEETHKEVIAELVDGLNADAIKQLDEADAA